MGKRLIVALIALAFALLIYSYFTDKSVFYSPVGSNSGTGSLGDGDEDEFPKIDICSGLTGSAWCECSFNSRRAECFQYNSWHEYNQCMISAFTFAHACLVEV